MPWLICKACGQGKLPKRPGFNHCPVCGHRFGWWNRLSLPAVSLRRTGLSSLRLPSWMWGRRVVWWMGAAAVTAVSGGVLLPRLGGLPENAAQSRANPVVHTADADQQETVSSRTIVEGMPNRQPTLRLGPIHLEYRRGGSERLHRAVLPSTESVSLTADDDYRLRFQPEESCYLYVFQSDTRGELSRLFPNREWSPDLSNPVHADQSYVLPSENAWYYLDEHPGQETIYIVAARRARSELEVTSAEALNSTVGWLADSSQLHGLDVAVIRFDFVHAVPPSQAAAAEPRGMPAPREAAPD